MKIQKSTGLTPFGGINFVLEELEDLGIGRMLNNHLGPLGSPSRYDWKDLVYSFWSVILCGGDCIEDIGGNFRSYLQGMPWMKIPSPDRILARFKELSGEREHPSSLRGTQGHDFSFHQVLCQLNLMLLKKTGGLQKSGGVLDYDNTYLFNDKADSRYTYKKANGYCPGVGLLDGRVVFIQNRNGNSGAHTFQSRTLERMFDQLREQGVGVEAFRADSASYQMDVIQTVDRNVERFYIRARMNAPLAEAISNIDNWVDIGTGQMRGDIPFTPFGNTAKKQGEPERLKTYRLVVTKEPRNDGQINLFTGEACCYWAILTNDQVMDNDRTVDFYNQRGAMEKEFDVLKNDFNWNRMPFSKLEQNTVFLYLSAMCRNIYGYIIRKFSAKFKMLRATDRLKKFIYRFITLPAKWTRHSRQMVLRIYGDIPLME